MWKSPTKPGFLGWCLILWLWGRDVISTTFYPKHANRLLSEMCIHRGQDSYASSFGGHIPIFRCPHISPYQWWLKPHCTTSIFTIIYAMMYIPNIFPSIYIDIH